MFSVDTMYHYIDVLKFTSENMPERVPEFLTDNNFLENWSQDPERRPSTEVFDAEIYNNEDSREMKLSKMFLDENISSARK